MQNEENAGQEEVAAAIRNLTDADYEKLMLIARHWYRQRYGALETRIKPEEILSEAIRRTLDCDRKWRKRKVSIVKHLDRVMESLSSHILEKRMTEVRGRKTLKSQIERARQERPYLDSGVENELIARQQLEMIGTLFADDEIALQVLRGRAQEKTAAEMRAELGLSETEYASVTKRILRKFVRHTKFLEGDDDD